MAWLRLIYHFLVVMADNTEAGRTVHDQQRLPIPAFRSRDHHVHECVTSLALTYLLLARLERSD